MRPVRVCLHGPESTGKTTLARELSEAFGTVWSPEFGRLYCEIFGNQCGADDLRAIVAGHKLMAAAAERKAGKLLILDTDPVMTAIWADVLLGERPGDLNNVDDPADLYLLADVDVPFTQDAIRYFPAPAAREAFFVRCKSELERRKLPFVVIAGDRASRRERAIAAIKDRFGAKLAP
jgi:HTH-type transcriptional regulator, transcriptional repressor of NAD biosynthesis genes